MTRRFGPGFASLLALGLAANAQAAPVRIPLQGVLTDAEGQPLQGSVVLEVALYDGPDAAEPVFGETLSVELGRGGHFAVLLGASSELTAEALEALADAHLGITVGDDEEMTPRLRVGTVPYAAVAQRAGTVPWSGVTGAPEGLLDGDDDTTYRAGEGLALAQDGTFSVERAVTDAWAKEAAYDTKAELKAELDEEYLPAGHRPAWSELQGIPPALADGDADTTYQAGAGLVLDGTTFSLDPNAVSDRARAVAYDTKAELKAELDAEYLPAAYAPQWSAVQGVPEDLADGDADTTYAAGSGLTLEGTTFAVDAAAVTSLAKDAAYDTKAELKAELDAEYLAAGAAPVAGSVGCPAGWTGFGSICISPTPVAAHHHTAVAHSCMLDQGGRLCTDSEIAGIRGWLGWFGAVGFWFADTLADDAAGFYSCAGCGGFVYNHDGATFRGDSRAGYCCRDR